MKNKKKKFNFALCKNLYKAKKKLREKATLAEKCLFNKLLKLNIWFKFQKCFNDLYIIVDFYIKELKLVIEIDGSVHNDFDQRLTDVARDKALNSKGIKVLRLSNKEAFKISSEDLWWKIKWC